MGGDSNSKTHGNITNIDGVVQLLGIGTKHWSENFVPVIRWLDTS